MMHKSQGKLMNVLKSVARETDEEPEPTVKTHLMHC